MSKTQIGQQNYFVKRFREKIRDKDTVQCLFEELKEKKLETLHSVGSKDQSHFYEETDKKQTGEIKIVVPLKIKIYLLRKFIYLLLGIISLVLGLHIGNIGVWFYIRACFMASFEGTKKALVNEEDTSSEIRSMLKWLLLYTISVMATICLMILQYTNVIQSLSYQGQTLWAICTWTTHALITLRIGMTMNIMKTCQVIRENIIKKFNVQIY